MGVTDIRFQVWGSRGGRNTHGSRIGNLTSCYSLRAGEDVFVFDAGRGLLVLAEAVTHAPTVPVGLPIRQRTPFWVCRVRT